MRFCLVEGRLGNGDAVRFGHALDPAGDVHRIAPIIVGEPARANDAADPRIQALWQQFDEGAIAEVVADGRLVLVDVTADWCITCSVNKALVLHRGHVLERLMGSDVVAMRADWTEPNDAISRYLSSFGRYGIPFDAVYGPGAPRGIALPELLTEDVVLGAVAHAQAKAGYRTAPRIATSR